MGKPVRGANAISGGRALIAELERRARLRRIGGQERMPEREGVLGRSFGTEKLQLGDGFGYGRAMSLWYPPQHDIRFSHPLEPLLAAAHDLDVCRPVDILVQRLYIPPDRDVDQGVFAQGTQRGRVAFLRLQTPDEAGRAVGDRVDSIEIGYEVGHSRRLERLFHEGYVQLGEFMGGHAGSFHWCGARCWIAPFFLLSLELLPRFGVRR